MYICMWKKLLFKLILNVSEKDIKTHKSQQQKMHAASQSRISYVLKTVVAVAAGIWCFFF